MTSRVLIADDSLTIQKVINITLASSGYELVECLNEADLLRKIQSSKFDLILLDFNLSDSRTGYELAKQVSETCPQAAIIVMLGTFDTVDESQFEECGIADKIVKPFESTKFIKKCRDLIEGQRPEITKSNKEKTQPKEETKADDIDSWTVEAPKRESAPVTPIHHEEEQAEEKVTLDPLSSEIEGWGFTPNNTLEEKFQKTFPPVIEEAAENHILDRLQTSSQFAQDLAEETDLDETDPSFEIPEDLNRDLLTEIDDDISAEAFWAVDEVVPKKSEEEEYIVESNLDEITADLTETVNQFRATEHVNAEINDSFGTDNIELTNYEMPSLETRPATAAIDEDAIVEKLKLSLRPMIEEMVKQYCRENAEKVAWEVIPDLAENLIRKEIKEISDSIH